MAGGVLNGIPCRGYEATEILNSDSASGTPPSLANSDRTVQSAVAVEESTSNAAALLVPFMPDDADLRAVSAFVVWASSLATNPVGIRDAALMAEGESLALKRREVMKRLIQSDPAHALRLALPWRLRGPLPAAVERNLEERVCGWGFFGVLHADDFEAGRSELRREVRLGGRTYAAYVCGKRASQKTRQKVFLHGIAMDGLMAVHEDSVRRLDVDEPGAEAGEARTCFVCAASLSIHGTPVWADLGDRVVGLCGEPHWRSLNGQVAGDFGGTRGAVEGPSYDSWTQGRKRLLYIRVAFPDDPGEPIREDEARNLMSDVNTWYVENSYDSTAITSDVTPLLMLPHTKAWYGLRGSTQLLDDSRQAARAAGFDSDQYDLDIIRHNRVPGFNWNGQSYVGGKGCWLQTSSLGITVHELGHNYGLTHANFWSATSDGVIGAGSNVEYGNTFDTMGSSQAANYQFSAQKKWELDWLPSQYFHMVTNSGVYRVYAFDVPQFVSSRRYGLRVRKDVFRDYWAEFRQKFTQNPWTQHGVLLNWDRWDNGAGNSAGGSHLLDTTPGTPTGNSSRDDAAVVLGRTFTDAAAGIHITPLAKGGAGAEAWIDVQVNVGLYPGNAPPVLQLAADSTSVSANAPVAFTADASDADGDALAYAWDFGDLSFGTNAPHVGKTWSTAGEYAVRCVVSDLKGGVASRFVVVRVGSPATYRVTGRVTGFADQPLEGVRVHNGLTGSGYRGTYTDSDGNYALVNLAGATYSLAAVKYGCILQPAGWANPVEVSADVAGLNWSGKAKPMVTLTAEDVSGGEQNLDRGTVRLSRTGPVTSSLTVNYMVTGNSSLDLDYTLSPPLSTWPTRITLPAGVSSTNFVVTPMNDVDSEGPENVIFTLAESPDYVIGSDAEVTVVIVDDEPPVRPTVYVSALARNDQSDDLMVEGNDDSAAFAFERYGSLAGPLSVQYSVSGSAQGGLDYTPLSGVVTIAAGESVGTVSFAAMDDLAVEGDETVTVTVLPDAAYVVGEYNSATVTLVDDDPTTVTIAATDSQAAENSSNTGRFTVTRVGNLTANLQVAYTLSGTASNAVDYSALPGRVLIPAGQATATITVSPLNDGMVEGAETIEVILAGGPTCNVGNPGTAVITLADDELPGVTLTLSDAVASEPGTDVGAFTFTRTGNTADPLIVYFDQFGTALNGVDCAALSSPVIIPAGTNSLEVVVAPLDDLIRETNETVILVLRSHPAYNVNTLSPLTLILADNDAGNLPGVGLTEASSESLENEMATVQLGVSLSVPSSSPVYVDYDVIGGTATSGSDFYPDPPQTLYFAPGKVTQSITAFSVDDDASVEADETVLVRLRNPVGAMLDAVTNHLHVILDDDTLKTVSVTAVDANASETGAGIGKFRISRSGNTSADLDVIFQRSGSASSPSDYLPINDSVTIPSGSSGIDLVVMPVDDATEEPLETVVLKLLSAPKAVIGVNNTATIYIADNDGNANVPIVSIHAGDPVAFERGPDPATFIITRDRNTNSALTVHYSIAGSALGGADYVSLGSPAVIPAGNAITTLSLTPLADAVEETNESVVVTLTITDDYRVSPAAASAAVELREIGPPRFDLSAGRSGLTSEGYHLRLTDLSGRGAVILYASSNLSDWQSILTGAPSTGPLDFLDTSATNQSLRFYRALEQ